MAQTTIMISFADLTGGMLVLHFFTFDPAWVPPLRSAGTTRIFYDGHCGLCHRLVRFVLAEDRFGEFRFAPLQSAPFQSVLSEGKHIEADAMVVETSDGKLLFRSAAVLQILERLGGVWRILAVIARFIPPALRDSTYDFVTRARYRLFRRPADACPPMPASIRARFDL